MAIGKDRDNTIRFNSYYGGLSTDRKVGIRNSYADGEAFDVRKSPSQMSVLPGFRKIVDSDLIGLVVSMLQTPDGNRWGYGDDGRLYKIDINNDVVKESDLVSGAERANGFRGDILYDNLHDSLIYTGTRDVMVYGRLKDNNVVSKKIETQADDSELMKYIPKVDFNGINWIGSGRLRGTYDGDGSVVKKTVIQTTLKEPTINKLEDWVEAENACVFLPGMSPVVKFGVQFQAKGTGGVSLIVHDNGHNEICRIRLENNQVFTDKETIFKMPVPSGQSRNSGMGELNLKPFKYYGLGGMYHIHLVADSLGWWVESYSDNKIVGMNFKAYCSPLSYQKYHPMIEHEGKLIIGNGEYLAVYDFDGSVDGVDNALFDRHRVLLGSSGWVVTSLARTDEYVVASAYNISEVESRPYQYGRLFFWDTYSDRANFWIDVPMGRPQSLYTYQNILYMIINGCLYAYTGGKELVKVRTLSDSQSEYSQLGDGTEVYNNMMTTRRGVMLFGYPSKTTLNNMRHGVYSWGSVDMNYPNALAYNYRVDQDEDDNKNSDDIRFEIGCLYSFGDSLYCAYRVVKNDVVHNNLGIVDNESLPAKKFSFESLAFDNGEPDNDKLALRMVVASKQLPDGVQVRLKYNIDDGGWVYADRVAGKDEKVYTTEINKRFRDIQFGFDGDSGSDNNISPEFYTVGLDYRNLEEERKIK